MRLYPASEIKAGFGPVTSPSDLIVVLCSNFLTPRNVTRSVALISVTSFAGQKTLNALKIPQFAEQPLATAVRRACASGRGDSSCSLSRPLLILRLTCWQPNEIPIVPRKPRRSHWHQTVNLEINHNLIADKWTARHYDLPIIDAREVMTRIETAK
jgi:hypothetical protein